MSIVLQAQPEYYSLAYNDNPYVFFSTAYTPTQRFKVVVLPSTYPTDPILATVRVFPRVGVTAGGTVQLNKAHYDPSRILQTQIAGNVAIPSANHPTLFDCPNMHYEYLLFIQSEDKVNGVYVGGAAKFTTVKSVWNGVNNLTDWLDFDYTDYDNAVTAKKFLTYAPRTQYIDSNQSAFLYFLTSNISQITKVKLTGYNAAGSAITSGVIDIAPTEKYNRIAIGTYDIIESDPADWSTGLPSTFLTGVSYYTVKIGNASFNLINSETFTFYVNAKCSKYTPVRLTWLNRLGGFDSFNFIYKSEVDTDVKRSTYQQEPHTFTGTDWQYTKASRGVTTYNVEMTSSIKVNSDFLTDTESAWMEDLFTSPVVYMEVDNQLIAVNVDGKNIKLQTSLNDKLSQYTFDITGAMVNNRQRG
jgi:hypothetical protein